jgi:hypothetical protein
MADNLGRRRSGRTSVRSSVRSSIKALDLTLIGEDSPLEDSKAALEQSLTSFRDQINLDPEETETTKKLKEEAEQLIVEAKRLSLEEKTSSRRQIQRMQAQASTLFMRYLEDGGDSDEDEYADVRGSSGGPSQNSLDRLRSAPEEQFHDPFSEFGN